MWEDIIKNQISIGRQSVRTRRRPLPEKSPPKECWPFFEKLIIDFVELNKIYDPESTSLMPSTLEKIRVEFPNEEYWCEFKETMEVYIDGDLPKGKNETNATYITIYGYVNGGKEKVILTFQFSLIFANSLRKTIWTMSCNFFYQAGLIQIYDKEINAYDWQYKELERIAGMSGIRFFCKVFYSWKSAVTEWLKRIGVDSIKYYGWPEFIINDCDKLVGDIQKSQIQTGRQEIKTSRLPLPEKTKTNCKETVLQIFYEFDKMNQWIYGRNHTEISDWFKSSEYYKLTEKEYCHFLETVRIIYQRAGSGFDHQNELLQLIGYFSVGIPFIIEYTILQTSSIINGVPTHWVPDFQIVLNSTTRGLRPLEKWIENDDMGEMIMYINEMDEERWEEFKGGLKLMYQERINKIKSLCNNPEVYMEIEPTSTFPENLNPPIKFK